MLRYARESAVTYFFISSTSWLEAISSWRVGVSIPYHHSHPVANEHEHVAILSDLPFIRDAGPWALPGTPGLEHRIGGLEKANITGNVSYDPENHEFMVRLRAQKVKNIENDIPDLKVEGDKNAELLIVGWGSTYGSITEAVNHARANGLKVAHAHFRYLNPLPKNTGEVLKKYKHIVCPEINLGQLSKILRQEFLVDIESFNKIQGLPFKSIEIESKIESLVGGNDNGK